MAKFEPGQGGRPKGAKNKTAPEIRESFKKLIAGNLDTLKEDLDTLKPKERVDAILKMAAFVVPKPVDTPGPQGHDRITVIRKTLHRRIGDQIIKTPLEPIYLEQ